MSRRVVELHAKIAGLAAELAAWRSLSAPGARLEKHHTQIAAITAALQVAVDHLTGRADSGDPWTATEHLLIRTHDVLDYFRAKFALRLADVFADYLTVADELAWECYEPVRTYAPRWREPPFVFLDRSAEPFSIARGSDYAAELIAKPQGTLRRVVERLPVPLIGVPWFHLRHLPDALVIAHEVGHLVETDLGLTPTLQRLIAGSGPDWQRWLGEVFADVYATLATGPGYLSALSDFLDTGSGGTGAGAYPPPEIRLDVVRAVLGGAVRTRAAEVARALTAGPYPELGGRRLDEILTFDRDLADRQASALLLRMAPDPRSNVRTLLASAALAFARDPETYQRAGTTDRVVGAAHRKITAGVRAAVTPRAAERDHEAGQAVLDLLR
ncbi:neutral zinc metallopeptidase [Herbidospora yilanensis]|uniref:neutral zinc metallopeptidase n=1 Tax=Herbidospora yilanensis TaxID=354426 RepID=UPI000B212CF0|nr:neutral zinc metallopeptidase [Herbidospora yilanensis]